MLLLGVLFPDRLGESSHGAIIGGMAAIALTAPVYWWLAIRPLGRAWRGECRLAQALFASPSAMVLVLDTKATIVRFNAGCERVLGYAAAEVLGQSLFERLLPHEVHEHVRQLIALCMSEERLPQNHQGEWLGRDGARRWIATTYDALCDDRGRVEYIVITGLDLTQLREQEVKLRVGEDRLKALIEATGQAAVLIDVEGTVLALNESAATMLNRDVASAIGRDVYAMLPSPLARIQRRRVAAVVASGRVNVIEDERSGVRMRQTLVPILGDEGLVRQVAFFSEDVTEATLLRRTDALLHGFDRLVVAGRSFDEILAYTCEQLVQVFGYELAVVGRKLPDGRVRMYPVVGRVPDYASAIETADIRWDASPHGDCPAGIVIRTGEGRAFSIRESAASPWATTARELGIKRVLGLPLVVRGESFGAVLIYSGNAHAFDHPDVVLSLQNIVARLSAVAEIAEKQAEMRLLRAAVETAGSGILVARADGTIQWANRALCRMTGYSEAELLGRNPRIFRSGTQERAYYEQFWATLARGEAWRGEIENKRKDGTVFTVLQTVAPVQGSDGEVTHYISVMEDISLRKSAEARIQHLAEHDALTDLPNRRLMQARLTRMLSGKKRRSEKLVGLLYLDVDRFKQVNDEYGHDVGDALLQGMAARLRGAVRETDTVARVGGDEFIVLLPGVQGIQDAELVARKILDSLRTPIACKGTAPVLVRTSIGVAVSSIHADTPADLIKCADVAMYEAKRAGRNTYRVFDSTSTPLAKAG